MNLKLIKKSVLILVPTLGAGTFIFTVDKPIDTAVPWVLFCVFMGLVAIRNTWTKRACGHGFVAQGKYGFFYPFVINRCWVCGKLYSEE